MRKRVSASRPLMSSICFGPRYSGGFNMYNAAALKKFGLIAKTALNYTNANFAASTTSHPQNNPHRPPSCPRTQEPRRARRSAIHSTYHHSSHPPAPCSLKTGSDNQQPPVHNCQLKTDNFPYPDGSAKNTGIFRVVLSWYSAYGGNASTAISHSRARSASSSTSRVRIE